MRNLYLFFIGLALGAAVGLLAGWNAFPVGISALGGSSVVEGLDGAWAEYRRRREVRGRGGLAAAGKAPDWVRTQMQLADIHERRRVGHGTLATEPVLVIRHGLGRQEVYDQNGDVIATGSTPRVPGQSRIETRIRSLASWAAREYADASGTALAAVRPDSSWRPKRFTVSTADGNDLGMVSVRDGMISGSGEVVGRVKKVGRWWRRHCELYDAQGTVVGRVVMTQASGWSTVNVIELDQQAAALRPLVLAIDATVSYWLRPRGE
jgi:hypothetical protein